MAKVLRCGNCKSYISQSELDHRKPPLHPWRLTEEGARIAAENEQRGGENPQCPECGHRCFLFETPRPPTAA